MKLSNSQLNKLKSGIKNDTEVTLNLSANVIGNSNDDTNSPHKLSLIDTQISKIRTAFTNDLSAKTQISKTQPSKIVQLGGVIRDKKQI